MLSRFAELQEPRFHEANLKSYKFQLLTRLARTGPRIAVDPTKSHALIEQTQRGGAYVFLTILEISLCEAVDASSPDLVVEQWSSLGIRIAWYGTRPPGVHPS